MYMLVYGVYNYMQTHWERNAIKFPIILMHDIFIAQGTLYARQRLKYTANNAHIHFVMLPSSVSVVAFR